MSPIVVGKWLTSSFLLQQGKEKIADDRRRELAGDSKSDHIMLVKAYEVIIFRITYCIS